MNQCECLAWTAPCSISTVQFRSLEGQLASSMNRGFDRVISRCDASLRRPAMSSSEKVPYSRSSAGAREDTPAHKQGRRQRQPGHLICAGPWAQMRSHSAPGHRAAAVRGPGTYEPPCARVGQGSLRGIPRLANITALFDVYEHHGNDEAALAVSLATEVGRTLFFLLPRRVDKV